MWARHQKYYTFYDVKIGQNFVCISSESPSTKMFEMGKFFHRVKLFVSGVSHMRGETFHTARVKHFLYEHRGGYAEVPGVTFLTEDARQCFWMTGILFGNR